MGQGFFLFLYLVPIKFPKTKKVKSRGAHLFLFRKGGGEVGGAGVSKHGILLGLQNIC